MIQLKVANLFFNQQAPQLEERNSRSRSPLKTSSGKRRNNSKPEKIYGKDFRVGDLIDFTQ